MTTTTVIIPAWRAGTFIDRTIASIMQQTVQPDSIMIGVDACVDTLKACQQLAKSNSKIKLYWFPNHCGCYRIRNTLAVLAAAEQLVLFDADDIMHTNYIETVLSLVKKGNFVRPKYLVEKTGLMVPGRFPAEGCITLLKEDFVDNAGWEPWLCAADSEFRFRAARRGLTPVVTDECIFTRVLHGDNLTKAPATNMQSEYRAWCRTQTEYRKTINFTRDSIALSRCVVVDPNLDLNEP